MIDTIASLIAHSHTQAAADAYRSFTPDRGQLQALASVGVEVLRHFPPMPGACAVMSAVWVARWQQLENTPVYVVAGALLVGTERVFGDESVAIDGTSVFSKSDPSWEGHCWLAFGNYVADISIFRTAYSAYSPRSSRGVWSSSSAGGADSRSVRRPTPRVQASTTGRSTS